MTLNGKAECDPFMESSQTPHKRITQCWPWLERAWVPVGWTWESVISEVEIHRRKLKLTVESPPTTEVEILPRNEHKVGERILQNLSSSLDFTSGQDNHMVFPSILSFTHLSCSVDHFALEVEKEILPRNECKAWERILQSFHQALPSLLWKKIRWNQRGHPFNPIIHTFTVFN